VADRLLFVRFDLRQRFFQQSGERQKFLS